MRHRNPREIWLGLLAITLVCAAIGACETFTKPENLEQRLAYAYSVHTAVLNAAANSVEAGEISAAQGRDILALADRSQAILDGARRALELGDMRSAEGQLALALAVLTELQTYLRRAPR